MATTEAVTAAGGVVYREDNGQRKVLLIFRRGVWDLPKGKLEDGERIAECAIREVAEEIGLEEAPQIIATLPDTYHEYQQGSTHFGKTTHWFVMQLEQQPETFTPQVDEGIQAVRWMSIAEARKSVGYDNLVTVLDVFAGL